MSDFATAAPVVTVVITAVALWLKIDRNRREYLREVEEKQKELCDHAIVTMHRPTAICDAKFYSKEDGVEVKTDVEALKKVTEEGFRRTHERLDRLINGKKSSD